MATLLVTGGAGYVGSHTVKALAAAGHTCVTFDNFSTGHRDFVKWGPLIEGDIRDPEALDGAFRRHRIDGVLHFAARAYVGESVADPGRYYAVNIGGTLALVEAMRRAAVNVIILSSSCAVYGSQGTEPISEDSPTNPINPYGYSKLICERLLEDFEVAHGLRSVRLRYFNAAGADPEGEIGEHHDPEPHLIPLVLDAAAGRRRDIHVFGTDYPTEDGTAVRDYVHVCDLASAHVAATEHLLRGGESTRLNLGAGAGVSVRQLISAAERVTGRQINAVDEARRPGDPAILRADAALARRTLSWTPLRSDIETILADAWAWSLKRFGDAHNQQGLTRQ